MSAITAIVMAALEKRNCSSQKINAGGRGTEEGDGRWEHSIAVINRDTLKRGNLNRARACARQEV